ncbi:unnamed protein product [Didymodactylos carnosus]|uniref:Uncharacterized protein n=1 Tax=Didymodactylos carnosus TaxID=1234261 RepID=A0A815QE67_9BILA|nr:unnamed protein product [Didymodactylos carnosus]CAF4331427.1 unnamed protein product [Didymodactylos carnosus]
MLKLSFISSNDQIRKEELQDKIRTITEFLNDLKNIENCFSRLWAESLTEICALLYIENPIITLLPKEIKCENYVPLCLKLIEIRSQLQERMIDIEEKTIDLWNARFDIPDTDQPKENSFNIFRNKTDDVIGLDPNLIFTPDPQLPTTPKPTTPMDPFDWEGLIPLGPASPSPPLPVVYEKTINYTSLFKLKITLISFPILFEKSRIQVEQLASKTQNTRFVITFKDGKQTKYHCSKPEKFYMQLKKIFDEKKYDLNTIGIIDSNQILVDFMKTNVNNSLPIIEEEYHIKEKRLLISIILEK